MPLDEIAEGLFATTSPVSFMGVPMSARTTVARLAGGGLFVCSPGALDDGLRRQLDALGQVRVLVAPNQFHHLFLGDWRAAYPEASVHIPPSLVRKRPDLSDAQLLGEAAPFEFGGEVDVCRMRGFPTIDETWFYHRASRTLIDTDLMHNMHDDPSWFARTTWRMMGAWKRFGPSRLERLLVRDRAGLRESVESALAWDFERIVVAHGDVLEAPDANDRVRAAWGWLLT